MFTFASPPHHMHRHYAQEAAVAMQEIEVISMDDGEDNVTTTALPSPPSSTRLASPSLVSLGSSSSMDHHHHNMHQPRDIHMTSSQTVLEEKQKQQQRADEALESLFAMLSKEQPLPTVDHRGRSFIKPTPINSESKGLSSTTFTTHDDNDDDPVNDHDRTKMCDWYYEMSDFLKIDRATASRSLTLLDRFMSTPMSSSSTILSSSSPVIANCTEYNVAGVVVAASQNRDEYQLVALTALFLAIKLFERLNIQPEHVSYLSRGRYTSEEVVRMEMIMLSALEWKVCTADKVDFVDAYLDVCLPSMKNVGKSSSSKKSEVAGEAGSSSCSDDNYCNDDPILISLRDLANLQIQLSDFESSFSTKKKSLVAFAAVINAYEMKKDALSRVDQHIFLESVQRLMNKMYPSRCYSAFGKGEREEFARTVERLRVLVDPSSDTGSSIPGTPTAVSSSSSNVELTPTSHQRYNNGAQQFKYQETSGIDISPLDVALESMENFDMAQLLCCGAGSEHHQDPAFQHNAIVADDTHDQDDCMVAEEVLAKLESTTSFCSAANSTNKKHAAAATAMTTNHSPTSITHILFGSGV